MRHVRVLLLLALVMVWLGSGAALTALPPAAGDPAAQAVGTGQVPTGLTPSEWEAIQAQVAKLTATDGAAGDYFGTSVLVSGDTAIVGAPYANVGSNADQGAAYIFYRDQGGAGAWGQVAKLTAADGTAEDYFGASVSVDGETAVVGAKGADGGMGHEDQGAAYVFYRDQGGPDAWGQVAKLIASDGAAADRFGSSLSLSGDTALVGAPEVNLGGSRRQGAAYVFYRDQGGPDGWGQVVKLIAVDGMARDWFGYSVSVSGETAVVGAAYANIGTNGDQGAAYVFYRDQDGPDAWGRVARLTAADGAAGDDFGTSVSLSGDTVVVGAPSADIAASADQGAAYVFYRDQGGPDAWGQVAKLAADDGAAEDAFGTSVSISGDTAVVGAPSAAVANGAADVFYRDQGGPDAWGQAAELTADDGAAEDDFGFSVSVADDTIIVGARRADVSDQSGQGAAYVYALPSPQDGVTVYLPLVGRNVAAP